MTGPVVPLSADLEAAVRLGRSAILRRPWIRDQGPTLAAHLEAELRAGRIPGALFSVSGAYRGIATWRPHGPLGVSLELLSIEPEAASADAFRSFLTGLRSLAGPIVFASGEFSGLTADEETRLMAELGFARFGRSEMEWPPGRPAPAAPTLPAGGTVRSVGRDDRLVLARLHRDAYYGRLDRYLFLEELDDGRDAERMMDDLFRGRWGEFAPEGSCAIEVGGRPVGAVLSVRRGRGVLIVDVMVDPAQQGRGVGRSVLAEAIRRAHAGGADRVFLNVTEGNERAIHLYQNLGFVRTLGPSVEWYDARIVPVPP